MSTWAVLGDVQGWGGAMARRLAATQGQVFLVGRSKLRGGRPKNLVCLSEAAEALAQTERVVIAEPVETLCPLLAEVAPLLGGHHRVLITTRGLTPKTYLRPSEAVLTYTAARQVAVLAGAADPSALKAKEPTALVIGSAYTTWANEIQEALSSGSLRVYTNADRVGVELSDALATVLAVALGAARAVGAGAATEATALTRAVAEMDRLVQGLGGRANTAHGLAGLGVLATLVFDPKTPSSMAGRAFVAGGTDPTTDHPQLAGLAGALAARARQARLRAPMVEVIAALFAGKVTAQDALAGLMNRAARSE